MDGEHTRGPGLRRLAEASRRAPKRFNLTQLERDAVRRSPQGIGESGSKPASVNLEDPVGLPRPLSLTLMEREASLLESAFRLKPHQDPAVTVTEVRRKLGMYAEEP